MAVLYYNAYNSTGAFSTGFIMELDTSDDDDNFERMRRVIAEAARHLASSEAVERLLDECYKEKPEHYESRDRPYTAVAPPISQTPRRVNRDRCPLHCSPALRQDPGRHPRPPPSVRPSDRVA